MTKVSLSRLPPGASFQTCLTGRCGIIVQKQYRGVRVVLDDFDRKVMSPDAVVMVSSYLAADL